MIEIYADHRENKTRVVSILRKKAKLMKRQLDIADYLLSDEIAVERKTANDFLQSIIDGRLFRQLSDLKNTYEKPILLIEGNIFETERKINHNAIMGAVASIATDMKIPMIWSENQNKTANMLLTIAKREQQTIKKNIRIRYKHKSISTNQQQIFLLSGLPKINHITAKRLLLHFKTPERIFTASEEELAQAEGIGKITAKKIRNLLTTEYEKSILED